MPDRHGAASQERSALRRRLQGYSGARPDVLRMIEGRPSRVLDVGCGAGLMAAALKDRFPSVYYVGVEPDGELAALAKAGADIVVAGPVENPETMAAAAAHAPYDLVLCADVLEHLAEPGPTLQALVGLMSAGGALITSVPNVRHISTFVSLGVLGTWPQRTRGIHDRGHLRFFARRDILELGRAAGLIMRKERRNLRLIEAKAWTMVPARLLDFWPFRSFFTFQYLHCWQRFQDEAG